MKDLWTPIAITPLSGMLDTRSRPADMQPGTWRYKLNFSINRTGALSVRSGHAAFNLGPLSGISVPNWDFHRRGSLVPREAITFLFEGSYSSPTEIVRRLFAGTPGSLSVLDNSTSEWSTLASGGSGSLWMGAQLNDKVYFTSGFSLGAMLAFSYPTLTPAAYSWGANGVIGQVRVVAAFSDVLLLMNGVQGGVRHSNRIWWSDYQNGTNFQVQAGGPSLAGLQDLDYGDDILAAAEMMGALYIFTTRSIWRCVPNITENSVFSFQKIYSEPKNKNGCLAYPNSLVTDGRQLFWLGNDSIWTFNPYIVAPESPEWLLKASGAIFSDTNADRMEKRCCESIVGNYRPLTKEVWFSYPQGLDSPSPVCVNNRCLVLNVEYKTADLVDTGYSAFVNFNPNPVSAQYCNADQIFIGASTIDYCLKSIGDVFYRENVNLIGGNRAAEIPDVSYSTTRVGYFARIVGKIPLGYPNKQKTVRSLELDSDITPNSLPAPNLLTLRIGNSFAPQDPIGTDDYCAVQYHQQPDVPLTCPDSVTLAAMAALGQNPSDPLAWTLFEQGQHLYLDIRITGPDGVTAPVEHDAAFSAFRFEVLIN